MSDQVSQPIQDAIKRIQDIVQRNPAEKGAIHERIFNLCSILQYPTRTLPDGTPLNAAPIKNNRNHADVSNDEDNFTANPINSISTEKAKNNSLNTEFSRRTANELERKRVNNRLNGFSLKNSIAWQEICKRYGPNLNQSELLSMAEIIGQQAGIKVDREAKRRKEVLIKWYEENLQVVLKVLPFFKLLDSDGNPLRGDDDPADLNKNYESDENNEENNDIGSENNDDGEDDNNENDNSIQENITNE